MDLVTDTEYPLETEFEAAHAAVNQANGRLLRSIAALDRDETWADQGYWNYAHWLARRLGTTNWRARRLITAAHALPRLPRIKAAFEAGELGLDKVIELCRYATAENEAKLAKWAQRVNTATVRAEADLANSRPREEVVDVDRRRYLSYWWADDRSHLALQGSLPADQGAVVAKALDRLADRLPDIVDEGDGVIAETHAVDSLEVRRADALVALASTAIAQDQDPDRATVVVHADLDALLGDGHSCELEQGPVIHAETARRLTCDARLQVVLNDGAGKPVGIGDVSRTVPRWLQRLLRRRDRGCTFPGCEMRRFLHAHHIKHWLWGGPTDLENLTLVCTFHHKLVHEYGWNVRLEPSGAVRWFPPGDREFERAPPVDQRVLAA